jgi:hypothetical protein
MLMNHTPTKLPTGSMAGLAAAGLGVLAVVCCAGAPLIVGVLGGIAVGGLLGAGAGVLTLGVVSALIVRWIRNRHACAVSGAQGPALRRRGDGS